MILGVNIVKATFTKIFITAPTAVKKLLKSIKIYRNAKDATHTRK